MTAGNFLHKNLDCLAGELDDAEVDEIEKVIAAAREKHEGHGGGHHRSMVGVRALPRDNDIALHEVRHLFPIAGVVTKDTTLHWRWKCTLPKPRPNTAQSVWGGKTKRTELDALIVCATNAWALFETMPGGFACPFDLNEKFISGED